MLGRFVTAAVADRHEVVPMDVVPGREAGVTPVDVLDLEGLTRAMKGCEAVIHLAALDQARAAPDGAFFHTNALGTWNVLMTAERLGLERAVICSSVAALGLAPGTPPESLPIPVHHPLRPVSAYGISKQVSEAVAAGFARRGRLKVACLRPALVTFPHQVAGWAAAADGMPSSTGPGSRAAPEPLPLTYAYVGPEDAGRAFAAALDAPIAGFTICYVTAADTLSRRPTLDVLAERMAARSPVTHPTLFAAMPGASPFDLEPTHRFLAWRPRDTWADVVARHGGAKVA